MTTRREAREARAAAENQAETDAIEDDAADEAPRKKRRWPWIIVFVILALIIAVAVAAIWYVTSLASSFNKAEKVPEKEIFPTVRPTEASPDDVNILMLGSDTRDSVGDDLDGIRAQRSDTIMLVHIPADRSGAQVISFMRDNWVEIPGYGEAKLNAAMSQGGVPLLVETLENIIDIPIDHVAITDFDGFIGLTDALDGVTVNNEKAFSSDGFDFAQGEITLRGDGALAYARARYPFTDGDYQRVRNQQAFIKGIVKKLISADTLTNPGRISSVVDTMSGYLTVDDGLTPQYLGPLALSLRDLRSDDITFLTSPTLGTGMIGDQSVVKPDWDGLKDLSNALKNDTVPEYAEKAAKKDK